MSLHRSQSIMIAMLAPTRYHHPGRRKYLIFPRKNHYLITCSSFAVSHARPAWVHAMTGATSRAIFSYQLRRGPFFGDSRCLIGGSWRYTLWPVPCRECASAPLSCTVLFGYVFDTRWSLTHRLSILAKTVARPRHHYGGATSLVHSCAMRVDCTLSSTDARGQYHSRRM